MDDDKVRLNESHQIKPIITINTTKNDKKLENLRFIELTKRCRPPNN